MTTNDVSFFIRIKRIEFVNFRNIEKGEIDFPNAEIYEYVEGNPSILGLYGQNGSGKSSVIMALGILKDALSGNTIGNNYQSCIRYGCDRCTLRFSFSLYGKMYNSAGKAIIDRDHSNHNEVFYEFDIVKNLIDDSEAILNENEIEKPANVLHIENEQIKIRIASEDGTIIYPKQIIINTRKSRAKKKTFLFGSQMKQDVFTNYDPETEQKYRELLAVSTARSQSFVFNPKVIELMMNSVESVLEDDEDVQKLYKYDANFKAPNSLNELRNTVEHLKSNDEEALSILMAMSLLFITPIMLIDSLHRYGRDYLQVIDTVTTGLTNINTKLPLLLWTSVPNDGVYYYRVPLNMDGPTTVKESSFLHVKSSLNAVSDVLYKIVPGMRLNLVDLGVHPSSKNVEVHSFDIISQREEVSIPLKYESDGIRRIVSIMSLLIAAYNDASFTIAIDEIDSGIFEYLLGELLSILSDSVKGQFVFTSHNLRPLEVLPAKYLCFTTTNPDKRFVKIPNRGNSNLRDTYFRSIILNTQKEQVYNPTDRHEIEMAFYKAGHEEVTDYE